MKKLLILSIAGLFLLAGCVSYRSLDFTSVTLGMTKAEVRNIIGPPERVLAVNQTTTGYLEVLQYRTRYDEVYALEFWNDRLSGYEFLYEDYIYVPVPYPPVAPPWGQPIFPGYRPPTVKPKPPVKPQPTPEPPTRPGTGTTNPTTPTRPSTGSTTNPTSPTRPSTGGTNTTTPTTPTRPSTGNSQGTSSSGSNATTPTRQPSSSSQTNTNTGSGTTNTRQNSGSENSGGGSSSGSSGTTTRRSTE